MAPVEELIVKSAASSPVSVNVPPVYVLANLPAVELSNSGLRTAAAIVILSPSCAVTTVFDVKAVFGFDATFVAAAVAVVTELPPRVSVFMRSIVTVIISAFVLPARISAEYEPSRTFTSLNAVLSAILSTSARSALISSCAFERSVSV